LIDGDHYDVDDPDGSLLKHAGRPVTLSSGPITGGCGPIADFKEVRFPARPQPPQMAAAARLPAEQTPFGTPILI
jgi:hypothetical protein